LRDAEVVPGPARGGDHACRDRVAIALIFGRDDDDALALPRDRRVVDVVEIEHLGGCLPRAPAQLADLELKADADRARLRATRLRDDEPRAVERLGRAGDLVTLGDELATIEPVDAELGVVLGGN